MSLDKVAQINSIKIGKGIQHIISEAGKILENPILVHDMSYKIIAMTENPVRDEPIWNEYEQHGTIGVNWLEFIRDECFIEAAANTKKLTFLYSDKLKYDRVYGKVFTKNNTQVGCAVITGCITPLSDEIYELFELVCDIITKGLCVSEFYRNYGQQYQELLINQLISGEITDKPLYAAHVESIYIGLKSHIHLALLTGGQGFDPVRIRELLMRVKPSFKYSVYNNYVVMLASTNERSPSINKLFGTLRNMIEEHNLYIGVSAGFDNLFDLPAYFQQAESALLEGREADGGQRIFQENV